MINENLAKRKRKLKTIELWKKGKTSSEIAATLGITRSAVMGIVNRAREKGLVDYRSKPEKAPTKSRPSRKKPSLAKIKLPPLLAVPLHTGIKSVELIPEKIEPVSFQNLTRTMCRFVVNEGKAQEYLFCGRQKFGHNPYCEEHCKECYVNILKYKPQTVGFRRSKYDPRA